MTPEDHDLPGTVIDKYRVDRVLGHGGMAVVYRVRHTTLGSVHALKRLTVPGRSVRQRLVQEGRLQASLRHPNVVAVTDILELDDGPALVLEYVGGPTLGTLLSEAPPTAEQRQVLCRGILRGVAAAHAAGLVHRDLKPENVLLGIQDAVVIPKIADFGLAKIGAEAGATRAGIAMGTPQFMSPEQIEDARSVDARADVFSLGAVLYEVLSGRSAFAAGSVVDLFGDIKAGRYTSLDEVAPHLPAHQRAAIHRALTPDRARRPADAAELLVDWLGPDGDGPAPGDVWTDEELERLRALGPGEPTAGELLGSLPSGSSGLSHLGMSTIAPPEDEPPRRSWFGLGLGLAAGATGLGAMGLGVVLIGVIALAALWPSPPPEPTAPAEPVVVVPELPPPEVAASTPAPASLPTPIVAPVASPAPRPPEPAPSEVAAVEVPVPEVAPEPAPVPEVPPPTPAGHGVVEVVGEIPLKLQQGSTIERPGVVPVGDWTIYARFGGADWTKAGTLTVRDGATVRVTCSTTRRMCQG